MIPQLTPEFPELTRATRVKNLLARPKHRQNQTAKPTGTPRQAGCKTSDVTRSKTQKTHGSQNAAKARAHAALTMPRRVAQCAASLLTRPARFQPSRPLSCDADLDRRRDEQNGQAHSRTATSIVEYPSRRWRGGPLVRFKMSRVDGVSGTRSSLMAPRSRRWRAGGVERWWRRQGQAPAKSQGEPSNAAPRNRQRRFRVKEIMI